MSKSIVEKCHQACSDANLQCEEQFLRRFLAALLAKRFVILTGLSGSGKTKLAQAFARWITPLESAPDPFKRGSTIGKTYRVLDADRIAVEFWSDAQGKVVLPRGIIEQWADYLAANPNLHDVGSQELRAKFNEEFTSPQGSRYGKQTNSWDSILKPAAQAILRARNQDVLGTRYYELISVGADWTSSDQILGYPDGLDKAHYIRTKALDLILRAEKSTLPHFLILDEMNLSHVERYFADLLSAIESDEPLHLHSSKDLDGNLTEIDGVPGEIKLPKNLFVIGTVNVDETTYMFSPKVLDRANVIEFRVSDDQLERFLQKPKSVDLRRVDAGGVIFAKEFLEMANQQVLLADEDRKKFEAELMLFFKSLQGAHAEFGFRVAKEAASFLYFHRLLDGDGWEFRAAMDAQILQKLLSKLHGSRNKLEPILCSLAILCFETRTWKVDEQTNRFVQIESLSVETAKAARMEDESMDPLGLAPNGNPSYPPGEAYYVLSFEKIIRMLERLRANGFVSFAEA